MNKQQKLLLTFILALGYAMVLIIGLTVGENVGKNTRIEKLEQELCESKQHDYCNKEELLKIIKKKKNC